MFYLHICNWDILQNIHIFLSNINYKLNQKQINCNTINNLLSITLFIHFIDIRDTIMILNNKVTRSVNFIPKLQLKHIEKELQNK